MFGPKVYVIVNGSVIHSLFQGKFAAGQTFVCKKIRTIAFCLKQWKATGAAGAIDP